MAQFASLLLYNNKPNTLVYIWYLVGNCDCSRKIIGRLELMQSKRIYSIEAQINSL